MANYNEDYFKPIDNTSEFISDMFGFIEENYGKCEDDEITCDIMNEILLHNQKLSNERVKYFHSINPSCYNYEEQEQPKNTISKPSIEEEYNHPKELTSIIEQLKYSNEDEIDNIIKRIPIEDYSILKIQLYKQLLNTKKELISALNKNPLANITNKQKEILRYKSILESLSYIQQEITEKEEEKKYNIIFVPNKNKESYFFEDLTNLIESSDELSIIFEKIISHQFLKSKGIRQLVSYDKLYEYKTKSGFRVLYVTMGNNNIAICSIFYKDKQKSIKIANNYEEALNRYKNNKTYIEENITTPDFLIEQNEFIAHIRTILENRNQYSLSKKNGVVTT